MIEIIEEIIGGEIVIGKSTVIEEIDLVLVGYLERVQKTGIGQNLIID